MAWTILSEPIPQPQLRDAERYLYVIERGAVRRDVIAELSGTLMASDPDSLPSPLDEVVRTKGASAITSWPGLMPPLVES